MTQIWVDKSEHKEPYQLTDPCSVHTEFSLLLYATPQVLYKPDRSLVLTLHQTYKWKDMHMGPVKPLYGGHPLTLLTSSDIPSYKTLVNKFFNPFFCKA